MWTGILLLANSLVMLYNTYISQRAKDQSRNTLVAQAVNQALHQITNMVTAGQISTQAAPATYFQIINSVLNAAQKGMLLTEDEANSATSQLTSLLAAKAKMA